MNDVENNIISEFRQLYASLNKWGNMVDKYILQFLTSDVIAKEHIQIPPKFRLKKEESYLDKALYRNKEYSNHLLDIEDKIGTRVILLKSDEVVQVAETLLKQNVWVAKKTKEFLQADPEKASIFNYQSIHLVCIPPTDSTDFPKEQISYLTCEIQIRTLLQHAFAEVSHDSTYKGVYKSDSEIIRKLAKSMALMEATDDYFCTVFEMMSDQQRYFSNYLIQLEKLFQKYVPSYSRSALNANLTDRIFDLLLHIKAEVEDIDRFTQTNDKDIKALLRNSNSMIAQQPAILLVAYFIMKAPNQLKEHWNLSPSILQHLFSSIGVSFDTY